MDGLTLIRAGRAVGLTIIADGERLVIRGPRRAGPVARALIERKADVMPRLADAKDWPSAAYERFLERLGAADDLHVDTTPGSPAWDVAIREARRAAAGIPDHLNRSRDPDLIDHALAAFAPFGGLTFVASQSTPQKALAPMRQAKVTVTPWHP